MCGSVTLLLRGQTDGTLLRPANQARLAISARAVELIGFQRLCRLPCDWTLNETDLSFFNPWCKKCSPGKIHLANHLFQFADFAKGL
jgi:hypothetical protein